jgi:hypothetical protein
VASSTDKDHLSMTTFPSSSTLDCSAFEVALDTGLEMDLTDCVYGPSHVHGQFANRPSTHYPFLAGLVRTQQLSHVLEIGTHYGGAIKAMWKGAGDPCRKNVLDGDCRFVTVDITMLNPQGLDPFITRVLGDALSPKVVRRVVSSFPERQVDLLFVDAGHDFGQTWQTIACYVNWLRPSLVAIDDIRLNRSMRKLWAKLEGLDGANATDVSDIIGRGSGFGVLQPDYPFHMGERGPIHLAASRAYWRAAHSVVGALPTSVKDPIPKVLRGGK